ncbi:MAG: universal stress protein [Vicingaceae bacterium]
MRKVLIPTDFSTNAENAVKYAFEMMRHTAEEVEFILLNTYYQPHGGSSTVLMSITDILKRDSEIGLKATLKKIRNEGHEETIRTVPMLGSLCSCIEIMMRNEDFDLIVMGTLGAGGIKKVLLGSNTSEVVGKIKLPILVVPHEAKYSPPDNILFTTDLRPTKREREVMSLLDFAAPLNSKIYILNIHQQKHLIDMENAIANSGLEKLFKGTDHSYHHRVDKDIIRGIEQFIDDHQIKIVAMIVRHLSFLESIFHKSLTREMAMHTKIPMLVLHDSA